MRVLPIQTAIRAKRDPEKAKFLQRFFKTGKGEYAAGDIFLGLTVPQTRDIIRMHLKELTLKDIRMLLMSEFHEERLAGLLALVALRKKNNVTADEAAKLYLSLTDRINNWDLVDSSAEYIVGPIAEKNPKLLKKLAVSKNLWERRIAMIATFHFIKQKRADEAIAIAKLLLNDTHDLMHKAVGWMLREVGKRVDEKLLIEFLDEHAAYMPRTALRYAIERLAPAKRATYLAVKQIKASSNASSRPHTGRKRR